MGIEYVLAVIVGICGTSAFAIRGLERRIEFLEKQSQRILQTLEFTHGNSREICSDQKLLLKNVDFLLLDTSKLHKNNSIHYEILANLDKTINPKENLETKIS